MTQPAPQDTSGQPPQDKAAIIEQLAQAAFAQLQHRTIAAAPAAVSATAGAQAEAAAEVDSRRSLEEMNQPSGDASPAAWDESWGMLYRVGPTGAYEYAYSDDHKTIRPGTAWMSQDEVAQSPGGVGGEATETTGVDVPSVVEQVMSEMASDSAAMAAELDISEEQARQLATDPEFQAMVAEALERASS